MLFRQSSPPGAVGDNRHNWQQHCQDAQSAFDKGNFAEAERVLRLAVPEAKGLSNQSDVSLTMDKLADSLYAQQKYSEADKIDGDVRSSSVARPSAHGYNSARVWRRPSGTACGDLPQARAM